MTAAEVARHFKARRYGKGYRAKCPVHKSRGLTLGIYADPDRVGIHCHAGCTSDEVLAAVGLTWKDMLYRNEWLDDKAYRELLTKRKAEEAKAAARHKELWHWIDETRKWETVAALLAPTAENPEASPEWHRALYMARMRWMRLSILWPSAPPVQGYKRARVASELTAEFVGAEIAAILWPHKDALTA